MYLFSFLSLGSSVSIATRLQTGQPRFSSWQGQWRDLHHSTQTTSRTHPASYKSVTEALSLGGRKQTEHETDHSLPPCVEVKNVWSYSPSITTWCGA